MCWTAWSKVATPFGRDCVFRGKIYQLEEHLNRLLASAHALLFEAVPKRDAVKQAVFDTSEANNMSDGVHIRLTLTRE